MQVASIKRKLIPYEGVIRFIVVLLISNLFWKLTMQGDESNRVLMFLGFNLTPVFVWTTHFVAQAGFWVVHLFTDSVSLVNNTIQFTTGYSVTVVWGCNGLKQLFIFFTILLFSRGPWKHKLWYVPIGCVFVVLINIARVAVLALVVQNHFDWFDFLHNYVLKYLFYALIFMIWVFWEDFLLPRFKKQKDISK